MAEARTRPGGLTRWAVTLPPAAFLVAFFLLPALIVVLASFRATGEFGGLAPLAGLAGLTLDAYGFLLGDVIYAEIFARSFAVAALTTLVCIVLAYPLAWLIARSPRQRRDFLVLLVILPFASNFLVRIYAWIMLLGPAGLLYTPFAVVAGLVYVHLPFMVLPLYTNLEKHDPALLEAAQDLGANAWTRFWRVTFPLSLPGVISAITLVFVPTIGDYVTPDLVGGPRGGMIAKMVYNGFKASDWPLAAATAILSMVFVAFVAFFLIQAIRLSVRSVK